MIISRNLKDYIVFDEEPLSNALTKISINKSHTVFVVSENGLLEGVITDGDIRRWILEQENLDLLIPCQVVMNRDFFSLNIASDRNLIEQSFNERIFIIPLLDNSKRIVGYAKPEGVGFAIGDHQISDQSGVYIIAEIGNNHQGDLAMAKQLIDLAHEAGADCAKFQMRQMSALYGEKDGDADEDLGAQYTLDLLNKFQLSNEDLFSAFDHCKSLGMTPLCTPWDLESLALLEDYGMVAYKVASADLTNYELLEALAKTGKPLICSTGMSSEPEIVEAIALLRRVGAQFALLHCNSTYPTPYKDINLSYLQRLKRISNTVVGYSGHERGYSVPIASISFGAKIIEKHFTLDRDLEGNDHKVSLLPEEFKAMVAGIRSVEDAIGEEKPRELTQGEMMNREVLAKSLMINRDLNSGEVIERSFIEVKSPGQGLQPNKLEELVGRVASRDFKKGDLFYDSDIAHEVVGPRNYKFDRPFGIPVRYHDFEKLTKMSNFDFVEFHLSYKDMDLEIDEFLAGTYDMGFAIHSPELFAGDHVMDLASSDQDYVDRSVMELNRVAEVTRKLKPYFPNTTKPVIVTNVGGWTKNGFLPKAERAALYEKVAKNLALVDESGVEIIIQTMPPFPWHFGGQCYHNLFVDGDEIAEFCQKHNRRICFDVSHSKLACNYDKKSFSEFTAKTGQYTAHLHVVDAKGVDGEGIQIGEGEVDFVELWRDLGKYAANVQFIPEIWQGHKNNGEGFWFSLEKLEDYNRASQEN